MAKSASSAVSQPAKKLTTAIGPGERTGRSALTANSAPSALTARYSHSNTSRALHDHRHALPAADAEGLQPVPLPVVREGVKQSGHDACAGHPKGMA